ncbi:5'-methylthioadenosine/adenosylhomocysteine nucleosidase [Marininema halotolerans]|uniref:adenosylhomocysteine nucleosidase n=1 Tax=Marininema halotolerans TaxID=1155944 RepID=A0A1I6QDY9_9BACL|nr:5'-methylthioadenosine/adenosylhomocysteine nucleosidase [Marininema halotolerans]SFS50701.1 adenosylhomocysteine nucleosidase [Marininema halotolerans]
MKSIPCVVIAAMHEELAPLKQRLHVEKEERVGGIHLTHAQIDGESIILAVCGIGKANAGATIQYLATVYSPEEIINIGSAGALTDRFSIGATVLVTESIYHDVDCTGVGEDPYTLPRVPSIIPSDLALIARLREAANQSGIPVAEGRVATGDSFISDGELRSQIHEGTKADCAEMETAAFAQIAQLNEVPFASIRSISDRADGTADISFDTFLRKISERNADLLEHYLSTRVATRIVS